MLNYSIIGERIKLCRKKQNLTQLELADKLNISVNYISRIECGKVEVSLKKLDNISEILNVDVTELLADANPNFDNYLVSDIINIFKEFPIKSRNSLKEILLKILETVES